MLQKTLGIVLHTLKYKDTSLIADIYTEVAGRASFMVSIPRSRKAAVKRSSPSRWHWWNLKPISVLMPLYIR